MANWISRIFNGKKANGRRANQRARLGVEVLEDRTAMSLGPLPAPGPTPMPGPAPPPLSPTYYWEPQFSNLYGSANNWLLDNGTRATAAPSATSDIVFDPVYSNAPCQLGPTLQDCHSLQMHVGYTGALDLSGGVLSVRGGTSKVNSGDIVADVARGGVGSLDVYGNGTVLDYNAPGWNVGTANPAGLAVTTRYGASVVVDSRCENVGASLAAGGWTYTGSVTWDTDAVFQNAATVVVAPQGTLNLQAGSYVGQAQITSWGTVNFGDGVNLTAAPGVPVRIVGGSLVTVGGGSGEVLGDLAVSNASIVMGLTSPSSYYTLTISGVLLMSNTIYSYDVDGGSNNSDQIAATSVDMLSGCTSSCYTVGTPTGGSHTYNPISYDPFSGLWEGSFESYRWGGPSAMAWIPGYFPLGLPPYGFVLTGAVA